MGSRSDPLRASLAEQLERMRGDGGELPEPLLDVVRETIPAGAAELTVILPRDWEELRHQEGAAGRTAPYWARLWPSGLALAERLADQGDLAGARVLELGCGLGAPSLVAARGGAAVMATDGSPDAVVFAAHNLALNSLEGEAAQVGWDEVGSLAGQDWDLVLAADVMYTSQNVAALLRLLPELLRRGGGDALIADPGRAGARDFLASARKVFRVKSDPAPGHDGVLLHRLRRPA